MILFTIDRVFTIFDPIRYRGDLYLRITWIGIFVVFSAGFFLFSPQLIYRGLKYEYGEEENETCVLLDPRLPGVNYLLFVQVICTLVSPILIIFVLNILIIVKLRQAKQSQLLLRYGQPKLYQVSTKPATAPISLGLNCTETKVTSLGINGSTSGTTAIEMSRIMGNLGLTVIFLFLSIPLAVVVVVRQNSDSMGYSITYQAYHKRLVDLSRFFSSFKSLRYIIDFWIYLLFILRFRQTMIRLFSSQSKESCRRSKLMSKLCFCCFSSMPKRRTSLSTKRFSSIQDRETKYSQTQSQFSRFKQELQNKNSASIFRPLKKTNWTRSSIADKNQIISSETSKLVLPDSLERQQVANPNCLSENISSKQIVSGPSSCTRPVEPVVCNSHSSLSNPSSLCIRDWSSLEYVDQSDSLVENFGHSMKSDLRSQPKCLEEEVDLNIP
ncbi:unnamed protein product [Protopolystoma xenopodis]|uniref:G-protein coupled receptors family 1 profile domain-containing protein n=1 Tax=Protopolystoma xenopodis TaxID=117903 RepID=A0A3S5CJ44_9PLAT|nr:unnamed protein product [Protopolystoma xenopodis]